MAERLLEMNQSRRDSGRITGKVLESLVTSEEVWLSAPDLANEANNSRVKLTRWSNSDLNEPLVVTSDQDEDCHLVTFALKRIDMNLRIGNKEVVSSSFPLHKPLLYCPTGDRRVAIFKSPFNCLRAFLPQDLMKECYETVMGKPASETVVLFETHFTDDPVVQSLTETLVALGDEESPYGPALLDAAGLALGARLVALSANKSYLEPNAPMPLAKRRLSRVLEYLEAYLNQPIYLADLANAAGLSRAHFSSQFRAATGLAPYAYILKRRVERAQDLLLDPSRSIADVSLQVGFSSQAHLTTAFKKIVGVSPGHWRSLSNAE